MKYIFFILALITFLNCSKDSTTAPIIDNPVDYANSKITSFSKNAGISGETITLNGENLSTDASKVALKFDANLATIVSASATEIKFILPVSAKTIPELKLTISNNNIQNKVVNEYTGNIGILPAPVYNSWQAIESTLIKQVGTNSPLVFKIQHIDSKKLYLTAEGNGGSVWRTIDGGISFNIWSLNDVTYKNGYWALEDGRGWASVSYFGVFNIPASGNPTGPYANPITGSNDNFYTVYVENNLTTGTVINGDGKVFTTTNGTSFNLVYSCPYITSTSGYKFLDGVNFSINNNAIWAAGTVRTNGSYYRPTVIYKNNVSNVWEEYLFPEEQYYNIFPRQLVFTSTTNGYLLVNKYTSSGFVFVSSKIFHTTDGGFSWAEVYNGTYLQNIAFKDASVGWATSGNKIFKTVDGGATWALDFTNNQIIRNISYKNNEVWAFSLDKFFKYRIQ